MDNLIELECSKSPMVPEPQLSITTAPLNLLTGGSYVDLHTTLDTMKRLAQEKTVSGFELQDLAEWDNRGPPRDVRTKKHRLDVWSTCEKHDLEEKIELTSHSSILSIHANRDVGIYLCSEDESEISHGRQLIRETLQLADAIGAHQAVFHLWDTWATNFDPNVLRDELAKIAALYPAVIPSVENVPTHLEGSTPYDNLEEFKWITLDTRWAGMYEELDAFSDVVERISNVHLRGSLENSQWQLHGAPYSFEEALQKIHREWGYRGLFTIEPERSSSVPTWNGIRNAMMSLWEKII